MSLVFDLSATFGDPETPSSGSFNFQGLASSQDIMEIVSGVASMDDQSPVIGAWFGSALTYGAQMVLTNPDDGITHGFVSGSWFGSDASWGVNGPTLENHDKTQVTSDSAPNIEQGINVGEYNPFPIPAVPPDAIQHIRDATRFQKAYSFSRNQPVRIRVFKR